MVKACLVASSVWILSSCLGIRAESSRILSINSYCARVSAFDLPHQHLEEIPSIPSGPFASGLDPRLWPISRGNGLKAIWRSTAIVLRAIIVTNATVIFPEAHIEHPMERNFHAPVLPDSCRKTGRVTRQRCEEKTRVRSRLPRPPRVVTLPSPHCGYSPRRL